MDTKKQIIKQLIVEEKHLTELLNKLSDEVIDELCQSMGMNRNQAITALFNLNNELINRLKKNYTVH